MNLKIPKYIRHESFKAGYQISKIEKFLKKLRVNKSKSSLNQYSIARNNLRSNLY